MTAMKTTSIGPLGRRVIQVLEREGLKVDGGFGGGTQPGTPGGTGFDGPVRAGLVEVRDPTSGRWLFAVGLRETDFNLRAGIGRSGETIVDSWPHDAEGHVDGRCFMFSHGDAMRTESFLGALGREVARHRLPAEDDAGRVRDALAEALPEVDGEILRGLAAAIGTGLDGDRISEMADRIRDVAAAFAGQPPRP